GRAVLGLGQALARRMVSDSPLRAASRPCSPVASSCGPRQEPPHLLPSDPAERLPPSAAARQRHCPHRRRLPSTTSCSSCSRTAASTTCWAGFPAPTGGRLA